MNLVQRLDREKMKPKLQKIFAANCKKGMGAEVLQSLVDNPDLLNCEGGAPLRMAAMGRNLGVLEVLMEEKELKVNLTGVVFNFPKTRYKQITMAILQM